MGILVIGALTIIGSMTWDQIEAYRIVIDPKEPND